MQVAVDGGQGGSRDCVARLQSRQSAVSHPGISVLLGTTLSLVELVALCLAGAGVATTDVVPGAGVQPDCVDVLEGVQPPHSAGVKPTSPSRETRTAGERARGS